MRGGERLLDNERGRIYRGVAARLNVLALDRADVQYAVKEVCREMSAPTEGGWRNLRRIIKYLIGCPRMVLVYKWQRLPKKIVVWVDGDHAGCKTTRKSNRGGC